MYVPALPELARSLGTDTSGAQVSLTGFLVGVIAGQLVLGPLSDGSGRRPVLLSGALGFAVLSVVCALAPTVVVLDAARFDQGVAGAAGIVVSRAVVADVFDDYDIADVFSRLGAITAAAPVLAPLAGGALLLVLPWRGVFLVLAVFGSALAVGCGSGSWSRCHHTRAAPVAWSRVTVDLRGRWHYEEVGLVIPSARSAGGSASTPPRMWNGCW
ncbi:MFS transporter [Nocardia grenadensis]|uniref:MFS transporter n=1 Tax=Nocardia grenadensis TaxID=931537 RepID=UPI003D74B172